MKRFEHILTRYTARWPEALILAAVLYAFGRTFFGGTHVPYI